MEASGFKIKTIRLISLSIIVVFMLICTAFAISDTVKNLSVADNSSSISSETDNHMSGINKSNYSNINEVEIPVSSQYETAVYLNDSSEFQTTSQYDISNDIQANSQYDSSNNKTSSFESSSSNLLTNSYYDNSDSSISSDKGYQGFIWMDIDRMQSEIDSLILNKFYDEIDSNTYSVPKYVFDFDKFYDIINIIKKYDWKDHRDYINPSQIKACEITVVGNDTLYTYLVFGRDENGKCFVWSFYDYKIAYPSEQDFEYIENIFLNVE